MTPPAASGASPRVVVVVQARTSSTRLPGKVLMPLAGAPSIVRMMQRVQRVQRADLRLVATSTDPSDDALAALCAEAGVPCVRGSLDDVLGRFVSAVPDSAEVVVRLTGDCPLIDPAIIDHHIERFVAEQPLAGYVTNAVRRTMPDGLDVEVVQPELLRRAHREATDRFDREHVLPWVRRHATTAHIAWATDLSAIRWTLDTPRDYEVISAIYDALYAEDPDFDTAAILRLLVRRPELLLIAGQDALDAADRTSWIQRIELHLQTPPPVPLQPRVPELP